MKRYWWGVIVALMVTCLLLLTASGSFSAADVDRSFSLDVDDDRAAIGVEDPRSIETSDNESVVKGVTITNRGPAHVTITADHPGETVADISHPVTLDPGDRDTLWVTFDCSNDPGSEHIDVYTTRDEADIVHSLEMTPDCST